jgi:hypothetical protein
VTLEKARFLPAGWRYHAAMSSAQTWDPATYARNARFVSDLGFPVLELSAPRPLCRRVWRLSDYATRLERAGFRVDSIALIPRPTPLPGDVSDWLETFAQSFFQGFSDLARTQVAT